MNVLRTMRSMTSLKVLLWVIVFSFIAAMFTVWGGGMDVENKTGGGLFASKYSVKVGKDSFPPGVFKLQYRFYVENVKRYLGEKNSARFLKGAGQRVMSQMARQLMLAQMARSYGLMVGDEEVADAIEKQNQFKDPKNDYPEFLGRMGTDAKTYQALVRNQLLLQKLNNLLTDSVYLSDAELKRLYKKENDKFKAVVALVSRDTFLNRQPRPAESVIRARYEKEKANLKTPEKRTVKYVSLSPTDIRKLIKVTDEEVKNYYRNHLDRFSIPKEQRRASHILIKVSKDAKPAEDLKAKKQAEEIYQKIKNGADFAEMARKYSDDKADASNGGDLGWFSRRQMVKAFSDAVFDEAKRVGDVIGPVRSPFGYHVIKLTGLGGGAKPFEQVKAQVKQVMLLEGSTYVARAKELMKEAKGAIGTAQDDKSVEEAARKYGTRVVSIQLPFTKEAGIPGLGKDKDLLEAVFSAAKGEWMKPVEMGKRWVRVKVTDVQLAHPSTFEEVGPELAKKIQREAAEAEAKTAATALVASVKKADEFEKRAKKAGYQVQKTGLINVEGTIPFAGRNLKLLKKAAATPEGKTIGPVLVKKGWLDAVIVKHVFPDMKKFEKDRKSFADGKLSKIARQMEDDYVNHRKAELEKDNAIFYNEALVQEMERATG